MAGESSSEDVSWSIRAVAWELVAVSFRYPDMQLAETLANGEWESAVKEVMEVAQLTLPIGWDDGLSCYGAGVEASDEQVFCSTNSLMSFLRHEATRLFVGAPHPACSPFEGVWRAEAEGVEALLFINPHSMSVERFMGECGLGRPEGTNEPLDHVSAECELLQYLASLAAGLVELPENAPALTDFPGGSPEAAYHQFLEEHARVWLPLFIECLVAETEQAFYRAAGAFLEAILRENEVPKQ